MTDVRTREHQESTFSILARTPRILVLAAVMTVGGATIGMKEVARWQVLHDAFGGPWGIGVYASLVAVATAGAGLVTGRLVDRQDSRLFLVGGLLIASVMSLLTGAGVAAGPLTVPQVLLGAVVDGIALGMVGPSLLKIQAAIVRPGAAGSAEILNILRLGIGGVAGAILGGRSPSPQATFEAAGVSGLVLAVVLVMVLWPVRSGATVARPRESASVIETLRSRPGLRRMVVVDLALADTIPTQLVNLVRASNGLVDLVAIAVTSGMAGLLLGRLILFWRGFRDRARTVLLVTTLALVALQLLTAGTLIDHWLERTTWVVVAIVTVASVMCAYSVGFTASAIQRTVPEEVRGRLSGILVAGRSVLIAGAALASSAVAAVIGAQGILLVLAGSLTLLIVLSRGFRGLDVQ